MLPAVAEVAVVTVAAAVVTMTAAVVGLTQFHQCHQCLSAEDVAAVEEMAAAIVVNIKI